MLIKCSIENFRSICDEVSLNLRPRKGSKLSEHKAGPCQGVYVLKSGVIFGPNASGKSNIVKALSAAKNIVMFGLDDDESIHDPFRLGEREQLLAPTKMVFQIQTQCHNYEYGFEYDNKRIKKEWLVEFTRKNRKLIFNRDSTLEDEYDLAHLLKTNKGVEKQQFIRFLAQGTASNKLFIHDLVIREVSKIINIDSVTNVFEWFVDKLCIVTPDRIYEQSYIAEVFKNKTFKEFYITLLRSFDLGIDDLKFDKVDFDDLPIPEAIKSNIRKSLVKNEDEINSDTLQKSTGILIGENNMYLFKHSNVGQIDAHKVQLVHKPYTNDRKEYFDISEESDGTKHIMELIPVVIDMLVKDKCFVFDEIERSLHTTVARTFIEVFFKACDKQKSQFIITSHDVQLLDQSLFRKDEIWFTSKDIKKQTILKCLDEFDVRYDHSIKERYLDCRFDAMPKVKQAEVIIQSLEEIKQ